MVANGLRGTVLIVGFGRRGQNALPMLPAPCAEVALVESNSDNIGAAGPFGIKVNHVIARSWTSYTLQGRCRSR